MAAGVREALGRLYWTGHGAVVGIPARDLLPHEYEAHGGLTYLLGLGIYTTESPPRTAAIEAAPRGETE